MSSISNRSSARRSKRLQSLSKAMLLPGAHNEPAEPDTEENNDPEFENMPALHAPDESDDDSEENRAPLPCPNGCLT